MDTWLAQLIPWLPAGAAVLCGLCATKRTTRKLAAPLCIMSIFGALIISVGLFPAVIRETREQHEARFQVQHNASAVEQMAETTDATAEAATTPTPNPTPTTTAAAATVTEAVPATTPAATQPSADEAANGESEFTTYTRPTREYGPLGIVVHSFDWISLAGFNAPFAFFFDSLTMIMLLVVTGVGLLVAIYAAGYMKGDRGYARFFAYVSLFIFAMTTLVMANNLVLLYLGWEGVGLCSYLLIGYYYDKPSAVAAAKKAFIVNRIGDLGFALGIFLTFTTFGTVEIAGPQGILSLIAQGKGDPGSTAVQFIPFLLLLGALGKSAQIPLYVWLPDAMEGPTPVSALIHAATMVTAGIYMIARLFPLFELSPGALATAAVLGCMTAFFAATIALCQNDIKRIFAYSTISQLGYMFVAVGTSSTDAGLFHLVTHAFFKALLFLTAGSVMHALAGQLDLRKMSGLRRKMPITAAMMFIGCLALAGFPFTAGFYSKDMILVNLFDHGFNGNSQSHKVLFIFGSLTAFITAFYTFRLWFRVFMGPERYEMGDEHHDVGHDPHAAPGHASDIKVEHHHEPHEMPWMMNLPLLVLTVGSLFAGYLLHERLPELVELSTAKPGPQTNLLPEHSVYDAHHVVMLLSSGVAIAGILLAAVFHWLNRPASEAVVRHFAQLAKLFENKYYIDELNDTFIVRPLHALGELLFVLDRLVVDGLVAVVGFVPRGLGWSIRPLHSGSLQGYGLGMVAGLATVLILMLIALR